MQEGKILSQACPVENIKNKIKGRKKEESEKNMQPLNLYTSLKSYPPKSFWSDYYKFVTGDSSLEMGTFAFTQGVEDSCWMLGSRFFRKEAIYYSPMKATIYNHPGFQELK